MDTNTIIQFHLENGSYSDKGIIYFSGRIKNELLEIDLEDIFSK